MFSQKFTPELKREVTNLVMKKNYTHCQAGDSSASSLSVIDFQTQSAPCLQKYLEQRSG
nr:hypothetical protein [Candidatus Hamiltonella defensa]